MVGAAPRQKLGEMLRQRGLLSDAALAECLTEHEHTSGPVGTILTHRGHVRELDLYRTLAAQHCMPFQDLLSDLPDSSLIDPENWQEYVQWRYVPLAFEGTALVVAGCGEPEALRCFLEKRYHCPVRFCYTAPRDILRTVERVCGKTLDARAREHLFATTPACSARPRPGRMTGPLVLFSVLTAVLLYVPGSFIAALCVCNLLYFTSLLFKLLLFTEGARATPVTHAAQANRSLPVYTILVPLYREAGSIPQLLDAIRALDYPPALLDVKLIVEGDDLGTIRAIRQACPEACFEMVIVPYSRPRTKPKACNYALAFARGEFVTIYDVEDQPDAQQLRKAVAAFRSLPPEVVCLQARLNYYNRRENILSALFSIEYATLFDYLLPGMAKLGIPIPLGGTSNHFRLEILRKLGEWDAYNVTEDADLGIRLAAEGYRTAMLDSETLEEAPITLGAWLRQRSRWIKGYMLTWRVAMRRPGILLRAVGIRGFLGFQMFVGVASLVFLVAPVLWVLSGLWLVRLPGVGAVPGWLLAVSAGIFMLGIAVQLVLAAMTVQRRGWEGMWRAILLFPFYWILHSFASFRALRQLFTAPFHWDKTEHGISRFCPGKTGSAGKGTAGAHGQQDITEQAQ